MIPLLRHSNAITKASSSLFCLSKATEVLICHRADQDAIGSSATRLPYLLRLSRRGRSWVLSEGQHAGFPSITLTDFNRREVAPELVRAAVLALKKNRTTPFSVFPDGIAIATYRMRRSWIVLGITAEVTHFLEPVRIIFFDSLPPTNRSCVRHINRVLFLFAAFLFKAE